MLPPEPAHALRPRRSRRCLTTCWQGPAADCRNQASPVDTTNPAANKAGRAQPRQRLALMRTWGAYSKQLSGLRVVPAVIRRVSISLVAGEVQSNGVFMEIRLANLTPAKPLAAIHAVFEKKGHNGHGRATGLELHDISCLEYL